MSVGFATRMTLVKPSAIRELLALGADPTITSFGGGYPDASLFPIGAFMEQFAKTLQEYGSTALQYGSSEGMPRLREQIAERMSRLGTPYTPANILILQGAQQGLDLVAKMLLNRGDLVLTERPTFLGALIAFNPCEPRYASIPMDAEGIELDHLEQALRREKPKFLYTIPDFHNPTGATMSLARRQGLIALANKYDLLILEDSPYREVRFEGEDLPPLKCLDTEDRVIHLGSFSKTLAPGFRLGWAVASAPIIEQLSLLKLAADTQCSSLNMSVVSSFLDNCDFESHIETIRQTYLHKKRTMLTALRKSFPQEVHFTNPEGGLFIWATFPSGFDTTSFMRDHALPEARVAYVPGATFFPNVQQENHARLSYATQSDDAITQGISRLGELVKRHLSIGTENRL